MPIIWSGSPNKYRRKILLGDVEAETKRLITECGERHQLKLLAVTTDIDHVHVFVSAPPRYSPANIANLLKGYTSRFLRQKFPKLKKICGEDKKILSFLGSNQSTHSH